MRFKAKTTLERVEQFIKEGTQTQLENQDFREIRKNMKLTDNLSDNMSILDKRAYIAR